MWTAAGVIVALLAAAVPAIRWWRKNRRARVDAEFVRLDYGAAEVLVWAERGGADATDVAVTLKYRENRGPEPIEQPFRIAKLRAGGTETHIPLFFFPEIVKQPLVATIDYTDRTGRRTEVIELTWPTW